MADPGLGFAVRRIDERSTDAQESALTNMPRISILLLFSFLLVPQLSSAQSNAEQSIPIRLEVHWIDWKDQETRKMATKETEPRSPVLEEMLIIVVNKALSEKGYHLDNSSQTTVRITGEGVTRTQRYKEFGTAKIMHLPTEYSGKYTVEVIGAEGKSKKFVDRFSFVPDYALDGTSNMAKGKLGWLVHYWFVKKLATKRFRRLLENRG